MGSEWWLRFWLIAYVVLSVGFVCNYLIMGDTSTLINVPNLFVKDALFVGLLVVVVADVRWFGGLMLVIVLGYVVLVVGEVFMLLRGGVESLIDDVFVRFMLLGWMVIDVALIVFFFWLWVAVVRGCHGLRYLHLVAFLSFVALVDVLIEGKREVVLLWQVVRNVDGYFVDVRVFCKRDVQLVLIVLCVWSFLIVWLLLLLLVSASRKRFLEKRFLEEDGVLCLVRCYVRVLIRIGSQMVYFGYYGDFDSWKSIGYILFWFCWGGWLLMLDDYCYLFLFLLKRLLCERFDIVVVGFGVVGGIFVYRFVAIGCEVLVIERGLYVDFCEFGDDEVTQYLWLYNEGVLQLAIDFELQVFQGVCVGGGMTINNALCMRLFEFVFVEWETCGLDRVALKMVIEEICWEFGVIQIPRGLAMVVARCFEWVVHDLDLLGIVELMYANIFGCFGIGYCNIGCGYGAKLTVLDIMLLKVQRRYGVKVFFDVEVERIDCVGDCAMWIVGTHVCGEWMVIEVVEIVVFVGVIGLSWFLQRSGIGGGVVG